MCVIIFVEKTKVIVWNKMEDNQWFDQKFKNIYMYIEYKTAVTQYNRDTLQENGDMFMVYDNSVFSNKK